MFLDNSDVIIDHKGMRSVIYDDIYFLPQNAIEESEYNFLEGNQLPQRFANLNATYGHQNFIVAETGFGTGLNFLLTANLWQKQSLSENQSLKLNYIAFEKHPLSLAQFKYIHSILKTNQLGAYQQLQQQYPQTYKFKYTISFDNIYLTLLVGDVLDLIKHYQFFADAWFLDGFDPKKNQQMWSLELFDKLYQHAYFKTTIATFTAASSVKRGLEKVGFNIKKTKGFGKKRERIIGNYSSFSSK